MQAAGSDSCFQVSRLYKVELFRKKPELVSSLCPLLCLFISRACVSVECTHLCWSHNPVKTSVVIKTNSGCTKHSTSQGFTGCCTDLNNVELLVETFFLFDSERDYIRTNLSLFRHYTFCLHEFWNKTLNNASVSLLACPICLSIPSHMWLDWSWRVLILGIRGLCWINDWCKKNICMGGWDGCEASGAWDIGIGVRLRRRLRWRSFSQGVGWWWAAAE